ncbi:metal-dependent hydrolase [Nocardia amamiensis]|uniref:metal-dependent hydrolase n=1 Tax=Nocardia amamiensis TaxID=404578 RepID=UPI00082E4BA0|nr:metal-dependent hydrolase [Nocardia amamiensis]
MNTSDTTKPPIRARRIRFHYPAGSLDRHYVHGDLVMSHLVAYLSATFPEGEDFFIRSVRRFADRITDPELRSQVKGFIGQEATHGREHRELNERLQHMGYPTRFVDRAIGRVVSLYERRLSPLTCLALTAAFEHYTAVAAETLLGDRRAQALLGDGEVRSILLWHALEESEHRSVAFDVYRAVGGSERRRIWAMRYGSAAFILAALLFTTASLLRDRASYKPFTLFRSLAALRHSPFVEPPVRQRLRDYNRAGFHPDDFDNNELLQHWTAELFGESGTLVDHLAIKTSPTTPDAPSR